MQDKDEDWDAEESDEEDNVDDDELDISDEDDAYFKKNRTKQSSKSGRSLKSTRELKSIASSTRRKKGRTSFEEDEEESSAEDSENGSDEDFRSTRRGAPVHRKNGGRSASVNISGRNNELRTSGRSVRKVSYVESDESEDFDEVKKKNQKVCLCYWILIFPLACRCDCYVYQSCNFFLLFVRELFCGLNFQKFKSSPFLLNELIMPCQLFPYLSLHADGVSLRLLVH